MAPEGGPASRVTEHGGRNAMESADGRILYYWRGGWVYRRPVSGGTETPVAEAQELLRLCLPSVIDKTRHRVPHGDHVWEVDVFHGDNAGLIIAEVELENEAISPKIPAWAGEEVSADARYFNSCLARDPFRKWPDEYRE